jgi:hypothetical protein
MGERDQCPYISIAGNWDDATLYISNFILFIPGGSRSGFISFRKTWIR